MIKKQDGQFCVVSEDGSRSFGCYDTKEEAERRLRQVEYFKHQGDSESWFVRVDSAIQFKKWEKTEEGYLKVFGVAAKVGLIEYTNEDGSPRVELIDDETLAEAAPDLVHQPIVEEHPAVPGGLLDASNVTNYQVGEVIHSEYNEDTGENEVRLLIRNQRTIKKVESGELRGLSPGYKLLRVPAKPGTGFDYVQRKRKYNHLALTKRPRRGEETSIRLDSADNVIIESTQPETGMPKEKSEGGEAGVNVDALADQVAKMQESIEALTDTVLELVPDADPEPNTDADPDPAAEHDAKLAWFDERKKALAVAEDLDVNVDSKATNEEIKTAIVAAQMGDEFNADSASADGYIDAAFTFVQKEAEKAAEEASQLDSFGDSFQFQPASKKNRNKRSFVDPTALEHGRRRSKRNSNSQEG